MKKKSIAKIVSYRIQAFKEIIMVIGSINLEKFDSEDLFMLSNYLIECARILKVDANTITIFKKKMQALDRRISDLLFENAVVDWEYVEDMFLSHSKGLLDLIADLAPEGARYEKLSEAVQSLAAIAMKHSELSPDKNRIKRNINLILMQEKCILRLYGNSKRVNNISKECSYVDTTSSEKEWMNKASSNNNSTIYENDG